MLSQEVVKGYRRNNLIPRSSSMTDIMKAFDSVERKFLFNVLMGWIFRLSFYILKEVLIQLKPCVTSPKYSILINGGLCDYF